MARILMYDTTTRQILGALPPTISAGTWGNQGTYASDKKITIDGIDRIIGLAAGVSALNFAGTIPGNFDDTFGDTPIQGLIFELNVALDTIQVIP